MIYPDSREGKPSERSRIAIASIIVGLPCRFLGRARGLTAFRHPHQSEEPGFEFRTQELARAVQFFMNCLPNMHLLARSYSLP